MHDQEGSIILTHAYALRFAEQGQAGTLNEDLPTARKHCLLLYPWNGLDQI